MAIKFGNKDLTSPRDIAAAFNKQYFSIPHKTSHSTRRIRKRVRKLTGIAPTFSCTQVQKAIRTANNSPAVGPDHLTMFHLKHFGPHALKYFTRILNRSISLCRIPSTWKQSTTIPLPKPGKDPSLGPSYRPVSLISPMVKVMERLLLPTLQETLPLAPHQHGFRSNHSTTTALATLVKDISDGLNQKKPNNRTVMVAIDLKAAFDTVNHNILITKLENSQLNPAITKWISNYLQGRKARTTFRDATSPACTVHQGVPQGSSISPTLFNFYLHDMPIPDRPIKLVTYADDITVYVTIQKINQAVDLLNNYLPRLERFLADHNLQISVQKSSVTLFTTWNREFNKHPAVLLNGTPLPLSKQPKILGVHLDASLTFSTHVKEMRKKAEGYNNVLKALAGTSWGKDKETLSTTFKATGRAVINYAAPVWSSFLANTNMAQLQIAQNNALRTITGCVKMTDIDHLHQETLIIPVKRHTDLLATQFVTQSLEPHHPCHHLTIRPPPPRFGEVHNIRDPFIRYGQTARDALHAAQGNVKNALTNLHTEAVNRARDSYRDNRVLGRRPPTISSKEKGLPRHSRTLLAQLRSGHCPKLKDYQHRINPATANICPDCGIGPHDVRHLFTCPAHRVSFHPIDLWRDPPRAAGELSYLISD